MKDNLNDSPQKRVSMYLTLFLTIVCVLSAYYISKNCYQLMMIQGRSMEPSFHNFQLVILDKRSMDYEKGDVIAFQCASLNTILVKRIAAAQGDSVKIDNGVLIVNNEPNDSYWEDFNYSGLLSDFTTLGEEEYIVIGDNTEESIDSRYVEVGIIHEADIIGEVVAFR